MIFADDELLCRAPGCLKRGIHQHHVVYRQHLKHSNPNDPRNALALCLHHHFQHHNRREVLPVHCLRAENLEFASDALGEDAAMLYLRRYYR